MSIFMTGRRWTTPHFIHLGMNWIGPIYTVDHWQNLCRIFIHSKRVLRNSHVHNVASEAFSSLLSYIMLFIVAIRTLSLHVCWDLSRSNHWISLPPKIKQLAAKIYIMCDCIIIICIINYTVGYCWIFILLTECTDFCMQGYWNSLIYVCSRCDF